MNRTIRVSQINMPVSHTRSQVINKALRIIGIKREHLVSAEIFRRSLDARKKDSIHYVYSLTLEIPENVHFRKGKQVQSVKPVRYAPEASGQEKIKSRIAVIGFGPAGIFCAYLLALNGYHPMVFERGREVCHRMEDVRKFWKEGILDPQSNVQFGEGGAGTFSDGKLNTMVKDRQGRNRFVLETFVRFGAPADILYDAKPHIGTDLLTDIISGIRREIIRLGGEVHFSGRVDRLAIKDGCLVGFEVTEDANKRFYPADSAVLCIGHSARDTFEMLFQEHVPMEPKSFAVGLRVEHPQEMINRAQYGADYDPALPVSSYKLTHRAASGRGVYSFCMCPGGYVVNASSERNRLAVNGMSEHARDSGNANSAVVLTVTPEDYPKTGTPLCGMQFQRQLEEKAFFLGKGRIPQQLFGDFENNRASSCYGTFSSCTKGASSFAGLQDLFSAEMNRDFIEGMHAFGRKIHGFDREDAILSGVESRTSSPVRILRDETFQSEVKNLYPCGEGAGYAGGITSAAMDGLKCAEAIMKRFAPVQKRSD